MRRRILYILVAVILVASLAGTAIARLGEPEPCNCTFGETATVEPTHTPMPTPAPMGVFLFLPLVAR